VLAKVPVGVTDMEPLCQFGLSRSTTVLAGPYRGDGYVGWLVELHFGVVSEGWVLWVFSNGGEDLGGGYVG
jgi:hypothetical protein